MKVFLVVMLSTLFPSLCECQIIRSPIDSIRVYYVELSLRNAEPISIDLLKHIPITKSTVISDTQQLALIKRNINMLTPDPKTYKYFDTHVLCELYIKRHKKLLQINGEKRYLLNGKYYSPFEDLFSLLYPKD